MPEAEEELVYIKPPNLLVVFQLVASNVYWIARKAVYGLRQSPKQWGLHRDDEVKKMRFRVGKKVLKAIQSSIDVAVWILVEDIDEDFDHKRSTYGYMLTYVDDFLMVGPTNILNAIEEEISRIWKYKSVPSIHQFDKKNPESSVTSFIDDDSIASEVWRIY